MRLIGRILVFAAALLAVLFALNNRDPIDLSLWPLPFEMRLPLFLALIGALTAGVMVGAALVWLGQARHRRRARAGQSAVIRQQREIEALRVKQMQTPAVLAGQGGDGRVNRSLGSLPPPI